MKKRRTKKKKRNRVKYAQSNHFSRPKQKSSSQHYSIKPLNREERLHHKHVKVAVAMKATNVKGRAEIFVSDAFLKHMCLIPQCQNYTSPNYQGYQMKTNSIVHVECEKNCDLCGRIYNRTTDHEHFTGYNLNVVNVNTEKESQVRLYHPEI
jgi:hypothetical protein